MLRLVEEPQEERRGTLSYWCELGPREHVTKGASFSLPFPLSIIPPTSYRPSSFSSSSDMLSSSTPVLPLAALAASLALAPLASAEIHYGATGVEYAKRFTPSSGLCFYQCPTLTYSDPDTHASMTAQPLNPQGTTASGSSVTTCSYQVTWVPGPGNTV